MVHHQAAVLREVLEVHRENSRAAVIPVDFRVEANLPAVDHRVAPEVEMVVTEAACRVTWVASLAAAVIWKTA